MARRHLSQRRARLRPAHLVALLLALPAGLAAGTLRAQPKPGYSPSSTHIFPAGGRRGTTVEARVGTECAPPATSFWLSGAGVTAPPVLGRERPAEGEPSPRRPPTETPITFPREWETRLTIADDAPLGTVLWRLSCAQGGTASRPFIVGDLPEFIETESNSAPDRAETISPPVTVNGRVHGERDVDYFRFAARAGETVSCEVVARRIGSVLDPVIDVLNAEGRPVAAARTYAGNDPVVVFRAAANGDYLLRIANVTLHGSPACVYRINVTRRPFVQYAFPAAGRAGETAAVELVALSGSDRVERSTAEVAFPESAGPFRYRDPRLSGVVEFEAVDAPHVFEAAGNDTRSTAQPIAPAVAVSGRLERPVDEDWFAFSAEAGRSYTLLCRGLPAGGACLPALVLLDESDRPLARARSVDAAHGLCRIHWQAPRTGGYFVRVRDQRHEVAGGDHFVYCLRLQEARPDFDLQLDADNADIVAGGGAEIEVVLLRRGGFLGPVDVRLEGLPDGVQVTNEKSPTKVHARIPAKRDRVKVKLQAAADAPVGPALLKIVGRGTAGERTIQRVAQAKHLGTDSQGIGVGPTKTPELQLTVRHKPLFRLSCAEAYQYAHRGSVYPYLMDVERLEGFDGEITLQLGDRQNRDLDGIRMIETVVPPGQTSVLLPIYLPETMHINVQSQSQLYSQAYATFTDRRGRPQSVLVLSEKRNMLRTLPPVVKLRAAAVEMQARPGEEVACRLQLERTSNFPGSMRVELLEATPAGCVSAETAVIAAHDTAGESRVAIAADAPPGPVELRFRATGNLTDDMLVISETVVRVIVAE